MFNKTDVARHEFALEWMRDADAFSEAVSCDTSYAAQLSRSLSLVRRAMPKAPKFLEELVAALQRRYGNMCWDASEQ